MGRGEILLPRLRVFLEKEYELQTTGRAKHKAVVRHDAQMTIDCFKNRIETYNHSQPVGEFFHPSALGACLRMLWYQEMKAPRNNKTTGHNLLRSHVTLEQGTYIHVFFQNLCERAGYLIQREFLTHSVPHKIIGHADGVLLINGEKYLLEIKSSNTRRFAQLVKGPYDEHKRQIMAYMKVLKLKKALIVYIDKDKSDTKEFCINYDEDFFQRFCAPRIKQHFRNIRNPRKPPAREGTNPNKLPCSYCDFNRVCHDSLEIKKYEKVCASKSIKLYVGNVR